MRILMFFALALLMAACGEPTDKASMAAVPPPAGTWHVEVLWKGQECTTIKIANFEKTEVCVDSYLYTQPAPFRAKEEIKPSNVANYVRKPKLEYRAHAVFVLRRPHKAVDDVEQENPIGE
jgi:hypothetical protein